VAERLGDAAMLFFDDFALDGPSDLPQWGGQPGADFARWRTPAFSAALESLKGGSTVTLPTLSASVGLERSRTTGPARFVVVEEPFGRLRPETARAIDFVVCIDAPLHVCLARRLLRQLRTLRRQAGAAATEGASADVLRSGAESFTDFLEFYVAWGHGVYAEQLRQQRASSDLVVDGLRSLDVLATQVGDAVWSAAGR
jgi:hypothetical protein